MNRRAMGSSFCIAFSLSPFSTLLAYCCGSTEVMMLHIIAISKGLSTVALFGLRAAMPTSTLQAMVTKISSDPIPF